VAVAKPRPAETLGRVEQGLDEAIMAALAAPLTLTGTNARLQVRNYGRDLYKLGGVSLMLDVAERVAHLDEGAYAARFGLMDELWDQIGNPASGRGVWLL
jgi:hypothetical protein